MQDNEPFAHYTYGFALAATGKAPEAEAQLRKAVALDPVYAAPHLVLGYVLE